MPNPFFYGGKALAKEYKQQIDYAFGKYQHRSNIRLLEIKETLLMTVPKSIGHFFLEVIGRANVTDTTSLITGWVIIIITLGVFIGWIQIDMIKEMWRFIFPIK